MCEDVGKMKKKEMTFKHKGELFSMPIKVFTPEEYERLIKKRKK